MKVTITRKLVDDEDYYVPHFTIETENTEMEDKFALFANFSARYIDHEEDEIDWDSVEFQGEKVGNVDQFLKENSDRFEESFKEKTIEFTYAELLVRKILNEHVFFYDWPPNADLYERQEFAKSISKELFKMDVAEIKELRTGPITIELLNKLDKAKELIRLESLPKNESETGRTGKVVYIKIAYLKTNGAIVPLANGRPIKRIESILNNN